MKTGEAGMTGKAPEKAVTRTTRQTRRSPRGDAARKAILESATQLFSEGGFNSASIADIAADVGMTQAGMLHHFPSKSALLLAVLLEREARNLRETEAEREKGLDPLTVFMHTLRNNDRNPPLVQLMTVLSAESIPDTHPAHEWFEERYREIAISTTANLTVMLDPKKLPPGVDAETIARWIIAMADGLRIQWLYDQDSVSRKASLALFYDMVLRPVLREPYRSFSWVEMVRNEDSPGVVS
jgi:AcrR family transcriptional regulator